MTTDGSRTALHTSQGLSGGTVQLTLFPHTMIDIQSQTYNGNVS